MLLVSIAKIRPGTKPRPSARFGFQLQVSHPRLSCGFLGVAGRGLRGQKTVRTKGTKALRRRYYAPFAHIRGLFSLALIVCWHPWATKHGALLLLRSAVGAWFYAPATAGACPGDYIQTMLDSQTFDLVWYSTAHWWKRICAMPSYSRISGVALAYGEQPRFALAVGSTCRLLLPFARRGWALVLLPSRQLRLVSNLTYVLQGPLQPSNRRFFQIPNAGWQRRNGVRPLVRGTARNPNDHPHGGRTRAIKYPRTPWGKTAKYPRAPRPVPRFKALQKRKKRQTTRPQPYWVAADSSEAELTPGAN